MSKILELREKRAKAWDTAKTFLDSKRGGDGLLSAEDTAIYEKMEADVVALGREVERLERQATIDLELSKATSSPIPTSLPSQMASISQVELPMNTRPTSLTPLRGKPLLHNVMSTIEDGDGGYLVPTEFERQIVMGLEEANILRSLAKTITTSAERKIPIAATHSIAQWTPENAAYTESNPTFLSEDY
jgi:HK97 family phage major capsid protein